MRGTSLVVQLFRLCTSNAEGVSLVPDLGTKIPNSRPGNSNPKCSAACQKINKSSDKNNKVFLKKKEKSAKSVTGNCASQMKVKSISCVQLLVTPQTVAQQAPLSMGFSRQGFWSGVPFPLPEDFPDSGMELRFYTLQADSLPSEPPRCSPDSFTIQR